MDLVLKQAPSLLLSKNNRLKTKEFILNFYSPLAVINELDEVNRKLGTMQIKNEKEICVIEEGFLSRDLNKLTFV